MSDIVKVDSTMLKGVRYMKDTNVLHAIFRDNSLYEYKDVPYDVYENLLNAESIGKYMQSCIIGKYPTSFIKKDKELD